MLVSQFRRQTRLKCETYVSSQESITTKPTRIHVLKVQRFHVWSGNIVLVGLEQFDSLTGQQRHETGPYSKRPRIKRSTVSPSAFPRLYFCLQTAEPLTMVQTCSGPQAAPLMGTPPEQVAGVFPSLF